MEPLSPDVPLVCGFRLGNTSVIGDSGVEAARVMALTVHDRDTHASDEEPEVTYVLPEQVAAALQDYLTKLMAIPASMTLD